MTHKERKNQMQTKLENILRRYCNINIETMTPEMQILYDLGLDSYGLISAANDIEAEFDTVLEDEELAKLETVGDIINLLKSKSK